MNYQMRAMEEDTFKQMLAQQTGTDPEQLKTLSIEQIGDTMSDTIDTMGSSLVKSMGIAYAVSVEKTAGVDVDHIQKSYLVTSGLKMVGMALLMGVVTVLVGFFASRVGAGIGMSLRDQVFKKVVGFSNAEMDKFSTASLIIRSTNDIQQIQMVSVMLLRMVAYAPILGIGGVIRVIKTGAGMGWIIILAILVILGYVMVLMSVSMPKFKLMQKLVDRINLVSREILTGLSVIRAFGREKKEEERFDEANKDLTRTMLFTNRVMSFMMLTMMSIMLPRAAVADNVKDSTVIIVAQRISTILHAEQILVLNDGRIVEKGTHEQLLKECEVYQQIAKSQLSARELGLEESEVADHE